MSSSPAFDLENEFGDRFWFWTGASGKRYIHSIYDPGDCPPLPGAIYIEVCRLGDGSRKALNAGRFSPFWDLAPGRTGGMRHGACHEIHVHLLAEDDKGAADVLDDLRAGLALTVQERPRRPAVMPRDRDQRCGFGEQPALPLFSGLAA